MQAGIPHLKYLPRACQGGFHPCIKVDEEVMVCIDDLDAFYQALGYSQEMAKTGVLPDEYIWEKYFKADAARCRICFQLHIVEYLAKYSARFMEKYGDRIDAWHAGHIDAGPASGEAGCFDCTIRKFCIRNQ